jgi:hypothetical protein
MLIEAAIWGDARFLCNHCMPKVAAVQHGHHHARLYAISLRWQDRSIVI